MGEEEDPAKAALQLASETTWCIEFLDKQLEGGKLSEKKIKELRKAKKLLKAENTPLPYQSGGRAGWCRRGGRPPRDCLVQLHQADAHLLC